MPLLAPVLGPEVVSAVCAGCELGTETGTGTGLRVDTGTWARMIGGTVVGRVMPKDAVLALGTTAAGCV